MELTIDVTPLYSSKSGGSAYNSTTNPMSGAMELTEWNSSALRFGYVSGGGTFYQASQFGTNDYWRYYQVDIKVDAQTINGQSYTAAQVAALLVGAEFTITIERDPDESPNNSVALFYTRGNPANAAAAAPNAAGSQPLELDNDASISDSAITFYFGVYADGATHTTDVTTQTADHVIHVAKNS